MIRKIISFIYINMYHHRMISIFNYLSKRGLSGTHDDCDYQRNKLAKILEETLSNIKYYENVKFNPKDFSYADFRKFPSLPKKL